MISPPCVRWNERTCERFRFYVRGSFLRFFSMTDECGPNIHGLSRTLFHAPESRQNDGFEVPVLHLEVHVVERMWSGVTSSGTRVWNCLGQNAANSSPPSVGCGGERDNRTIDVLIVGGGIVGITLGYFLRLFDPTLDVLVVEKYSVASGATGLSAGTIFCPGYGDYSDPGAIASVESTKLMDSMHSRGFVE